MYMPLIAKMVENNPSLMAPKVNFELFMIGIYSFFFFVCCLFCK
jgi:hypothetical protein